jgi:DNA-binding NarL/FixJ family response regulator
MKLTPRERETLLLAAQGLTSVEIGRRMQINDAAVWFNLTSIRRRLGLPPGCPRPQIVSAYIASLQAEISAFDIARKVAA